MYPVRYEADYIEPQNRAKGIFRWILVIPWAILAGVYGLVASVVALLAWFALLFTGRYPQGLYEFNVGFLRFTGRFYAFAFLQTEEWPPIGFDDERGYPVRVDVDPPLPSYNRAKTFFRLVLGIPVLFMVTLLQYLYLTAATIAWFHIAFMGRTSGGIHNALTVGLVYQLRSVAYFLLLTETLPPVSDQQPAANVGAEAPATRKALARGAAAKTAATKGAAAPKATPARKPAGAKDPAAAKKAATGSRTSTSKAKPSASKRSSAAKPRAKPAAKKSPSKPKPATRRKPTSGKS